MRCPGELSPSTAAAVHHHAASSVAPATLTAYASDWRGFSRWCEVQDLAALPASPATVAPSTIARHLSAIGQRHQAAGAGRPNQSDPVRVVMGGIRRELGTAPRQEV